MQLNLIDFNSKMRKGLSMMAAFWQKIHMYVFYLILLFAILLGGYIWKNSLSEEGWSEQKKQDYLNGQKQDVVLKEDSFKKVIDMIRERKSVNPEPQNQIKDIFVQYK